MAQAASMAAGLGERFHTLTEWAKTNGEAVLDALVADSEPVAKNG